MKKLTAFVSVALLGVTAAQASGTGNKEQKLACEYPVVVQDLDKAGLKLAPCAAPEIDPASAMAGLTLLLGGLAVVRGRVMKKKQD